jgi:hypothetical protein
MRDIAIDLELLGEHVVLLGNQVHDSAGPVLTWRLITFLNRVLGRIRSLIGKRATSLVKSGTDLALDYVKWVTFLATMGTR